VLACNSTVGAGETLLKTPKDILPPSFSAQRGWLIGLAVVVTLAAVAYWISWLRRTKPLVITPPDVLARSALDALHGKTEDGELVSEVSRVLRHYVMAAFSLPPDEFTTTELQKALQLHPQISPELADAIIQFLRRCDEWKFAPAPSAAPAGVAASALELLEKTEPQRKLTAVHPQRPVGNHA
jgi:hypothetical protein